MKTTSALKTKIIKVESPTTDTVEPYGVMLGRNTDIEPLPIISYDGAVEVRRVGNFVSDEQTEMPVCTVKKRPYEAIWMERHSKHTQTFISLGSKPFIALFAPPNNEELPDLDLAKAFLFDGSVGFMMHLGTWHEFPFAVFDDTDILVILRKEATDSLSNENVMDGEAMGPDLEKRNLAHRYGIKIKLEI